MTRRQIVDITELAVLGEQFPPRLMQLGFRMMQVIDAGRDRYRYVLPPVCEVPAGPFLMGSSKQLDPSAEIPELPQHTVTLNVYHIGVYPLTVAEYACFMQATNRDPPLEWANQRHADHPVVYALWDDVLAYARWLAQVTGDDWRLPTEAEWEKAARGTDGRIYPWGDQWDPTRANTSEGGPGEWTPVGSYPHGASPYGAQDMAGNVWEWTSTEWRDYPYQANDGREDLNSQDLKVLRGGSYENNHDCVRAAYRVADLDAGLANGVRLVRGGVAN